MWEVISIYSERKVAVVDGCWIRVLDKSILDCSGDDDGLNVFWATVEVQYLNLDIAGDIANISSSL